MYLCKFKRHSHIKCFGDFKVAKGSNKHKMSKKKDIVWYNQEGTRSEQISVSDLPLFTIGKKKSNELSMLSLFSGCGGMDLGFEGGFICHKKSMPKNSKRIAKIINDDWVLLKRNRFTTVFANDILPHQDGLGPTIRSEHHEIIEYRRLSAEHGGCYIEELSQSQQEKKYWVKKT